MDAVREAITRLAPNDFTVLITGESGTGKELVARALHQYSSRHHGPFVAVNCAAFVDTLLEAELFGIEDRTATGVQGRAGKFELAHGGTIFLDEVAELSNRAQAALLRTLQDLTIERVGGHRSRRIDARVVVATNDSLANLVERHRFRADLFYRVSGIEISLPPLRERPEDIPALVEHFVEVHGGEGRTICRQAIDLFQRYHWPGNIRELERIVQRCLAWSVDREIGVTALPHHLGQNQRAAQFGSPRPTSLRAWAAVYVQTVFHECGGNKRLACRRLQINYRTLQSYLLYDQTQDRAAAA
jgi:transcriptional regulator with PAS, ATPase and Fis domain